MDEVESLKERVRLAVMAFCEEQMAVRGGTAWVDIHPRSILATISAAPCPAERDSARDKESRDRIGRLYSDLFDASRKSLEAAVEAIVGQPVLRSWMSVAPESGDHVIQFSFKHDVCA